DPYIATKPARVRTAEMFPCAGKDISPYGDEHSVNRALRIRVTAADSSSRRNPSREFTWRRSPILLRKSRHPSRCSQFGFSGGFLLQSDGTASAKGSAR